jgi:hypothetical protein
LFKFATFRASDVNSRDALAATYFTTYVVYSMTTFYGPHLSFTLMMGHSFSHKDQDSVWQCMVQSRNTVWITVRGNRVPKRAILYNCHDSIAIILVLLRSTDLVSCKNLKHLNLVEMSEKSCRVSNACEFVLKNHITCVIKSHTVLLAENTKTKKITNNIFMEGRSV